MPLWFSTFARVHSAKEEAPALWQGGDVRKFVPRRTLAKSFPRWLSASPLRVAAMAERDLLVEYGDFFIHFSVPARGVQRAREHALGAVQYFLGVAYHFPKRPRGCARYCSEPVSSCLDFF